MSHIFHHSIHNNNCPQLLHHLRNTRTQMHTKEYTLCLHRMPSQISAPVPVAYSPSIQRIPQKTLLLPHLRIGKRTYSTYQQGCLDDLPSATRQASAIRAALQHTLHIPCLPPAAPAPRVKHTRVPPSHWPSGRPFFLPSSPPGLPHCSPQPLHSLQRLSQRSILEFTSSLFS